MFVYIWRVSNKPSQDLSKHTPVIAHTWSPSNGSAECLCASILRTATTSHVSAALHISSVAQTRGQFGSDITPSRPQFYLPTNLPHPFAKHHPRLLLPLRTYLKSKRLSKLYRCGFRWHSNAEAPVAQPRKPSDCDSKMLLHSGQSSSGGEVTWGVDLASTSDFTRTRAGAWALDIARVDRRVFALIKC